MSDKAFGWIVTATASHGIEPLTKVWYTACPEMAAAIEFGALGNQRPCGDLRNKPRVVRDSDAFIWPAKRGSKVL